MKSMKRMRKSNKAALVPNYCPSLKGVLTSLLNFACLFPVIEIPPPRGLDIPWATSLAGTTS